MTDFPSLSPDTAPIGARPMLLGSLKQFGFVPEPVARSAASPAALTHLMAGFAAFDRSSLSVIEREVVAMTVAFAHGCHYCMAFHSAKLAAEPAHAELLAALRAGAALPDARLEALRRFTLAVLETRARPDAETWAAFTAAGFGAAGALDVVLGVGVYVLSTYLNIITDAQLDAPFLAFAWQPPQ